MTKECLNPSCKKSFQPGHYGDRQLVCGSGLCTKWYKIYWSQIRKPPRNMPEPEQRRALAASEKEDLRYWALLVTARTSALRKGELLGIVWSDVEDGKDIRSNFPLRGQWDDKVGFKIRKTGDGRIAYFLKDVRDALRRLRAGEAKSDKASDRIWPYTEVRAWERWINLQKKLKISNPDTGRPYRFHDLRHMAAYRALKRTGKLHDATILCDHRNPATTLIYTQQRPEEFVKSIEG